MHLDDGDEGLGQWVALATAALSAASQGGLFAGKVHYSPYGFLYDDYPQKIWEAEKAIAEGTGQPIPPQFSKTGGAQYQASMLAIVPKYVPGSEQMIANYDRRLNEAGGAYEVTYGKQLDRLKKLVAGQTVPPPALATAVIPAQSSSAAVPIAAQPNLPALTQDVFQTPGVAPAPGQPGYPPPPGARPIMQASMFPDLSQIPLPVILGAGALLLLLLVQGHSPSKR